MEIGAGTMDLGVQTHFSQGWNPNLITKLKALGVSEIRDSQPWAGVEKQAGTYSYSTGLTNYMALAKDDGISALLTFSSANALYDGGHTPYTEAGRKAYAAYIVDVLTKYAGQIEEVEIWNEFNNAGAFTGPAAANKAAAYTALLKTVYETVKPLFPDVEILGGSTNSVGTGSLESVFKLGALDYMDGVVVHPYRATAEGLDGELIHLQEVMARYGAVKPIYATEFGSQFDDPADVPDFMLKMATLMSSAHVAEAYWYALIDQKFFANMGLLTTAGEAKPAAAAFIFLQDTLLPLGDAVRVDVGDPQALIYRFGTDTYVIWGSARDIRFDGGGQFYDARGEAIAAPPSIGDAPVVFKGTGFNLGADRVVADSLYDYDQGVFQYFVKNAAGVHVELGLIDWEWTSYLGNKWTKPLRVNADSIAPAGTGAAPLQVVERYVSDRTQTIEIDASWQLGGTGGDGVDLHILVNGREIITKLVTDAFSLVDFRLTLEQGDMVDFALGPNQAVGGDSTARRITITRVETGLTLDGTAANDVLRGGTGNDALRGAAGRDSLIGGDGDDLLAGGAGHNRLDGGAGFDTAIYADAPSAIKVKGNIVSGPAYDTLVSVEAVIGTDFGDKFHGSVQSEQLYGGGGDDLFQVAGGHHLFDGGDGIDTVSFADWSSGVVLSLAERGEQVIDATTTLRLAGIETLIGSDFADSLRADITGSRLQGAKGDDLLIGGGGGDMLLGGAGTDTASYAGAQAGVTVSLDLATAQNTIGAGLDTLGSIERLVGSNFADRLTGSRFADAIAGGAGNDRIAGGMGADVLTGGGGADRFIFAALSDSRVKAPDMILDFSHGQGDRIDLSAIDANTVLKGDNSFALVNAFTLQAGQLLVVPDDGGFLVSGDVNGDGIADFALHVVADYRPGASDFWL